MNPIRAVAFDLDGTLTESKQPVAASVAASLARLAQKMPVAVMSGGGWRQFVVQFLSSFPPGADFSRIFLFPDSAAQCFSFKDGSWRAVYDMQMSAEERAMIIASIHEAAAESNFPQPERLWGEQIDDRGAEITFSALGQLAPLEEKKAWDPDRSKRMPLYRALAEKLPGYTVALNSSTSIDITRKGFTKAYGVRKFSEFVRVPVSEMIYVGDALQEGGNDHAAVETGVQTHAVSGPGETAAFINQLLSS